MKKILKSALIDTLPVMSGYLVLGFGFGILLKSNGYSLWLVLAMSVCIYAGSMQYVAVGLFTGGASVITALITTAMVNARHLFYGISMLSKYAGTGKRKPYLMFSLTDETYSLLCEDNKPFTETKDIHNYYLFVSLFDHCYWIIGSLLGAVVGALVPLNTEGFDFALTALFITIFTEQWLSHKDHFPAMTGMLASVLCLLVFKADNFLIPSMLVIAVVLCFCKREVTHERK